MTTPYPKGRPNMQHVADAAGVSKSAVSLALKNDPRLPEATRLRIQKVALDLGYRHNPMMASLMTQLRASRSPLLQTTIAWIEFYPEINELEEDSDCPYHIGAMERAKEMGFVLEPIRVSPEVLDIEGMQTIFDEKKIQGAIIYIPSYLNPLPKPFRDMWAQLACVLVGPYSPSVFLPRAMTDAYQTTNCAVQHALALGYQRPGLVIKSDVDRLQDGRFISGFQKSVALGDSAVHAYEALDEAHFMEWFAQYNPDIILTDCTDVRAWLESSVYRPNRHIGWIHLNKQPPLAWAGMQQNHDQVGSNAVDLVVAQLYRAEKGTHENAKTVLTASSWSLGDSVRFNAQNENRGNTN